MKRSSLLIALFLLSSAAVNSANAAAKFEGVSLPGSPKGNPSFFQIDVATGKVWSLWGVAATVLTPTVDNTPLPAGDYHLSSSTNIEADGTLYWMVNRMDATNGRIWTLTGGGTAPLVWVEVQPPK